MGKEALRQYEPLEPLEIGRHTIEVPIVQGAMAIRGSGPKLVKAVLDEGGLGTLAGTGIGFGLKEYAGLPPVEADCRALRSAFEMIRESNPNVPVAVNVLVAVKHFPEVVTEALASGADIIVAGAGLPLDLPVLAKSYPDVALVPILSSTQAVRVLCARWWSRYKRLPDGIVIEAPSMAGGHLGVTRGPGTIYDDSLKPERVIPECIAHLRDKYPDNRISLIAAGGIWDRSDIERMRELGAEGFQIATRLVCTYECDFPDAVKKWYIEKATLDNIQITISPVGYPGRVVGTPLSERVKRGEHIGHTCIASCLTHCTLRDSKGKRGYCIVRALTNACDGNIEEAIVFAGSNAWRSDKIVSVRDIFAELTDNSY